MPDTPEHMPVNMVVLEPVADKFNTKLGGRPPGLLPTPLAVITKVLLLVVFTLPTSMVAVPVTRVPDAPARRPRSQTQSRPVPTNRTT